MPRAPRSAVAPAASPRPKGRQRHDPSPIPFYAKLTTREKGYIEGYINTRTGTKISKRAYLDKQAQNQGWESYAIYSAVSKEAGGLGGMGSAASQIVLGTMYNAGIDPAEFIETARAFGPELRAVAKEPENKAAHGALAEWLEALGLREQDAGYDVGDTPKV